MQKITVINTWELWAENFEDAKRFFKSEGNIKTRSKLKDKWYKNYIKQLERVNGPIKDKK